MDDMAHQSLKDKDHCPRNTLGSIGQKCTCRRYQDEDVHQDRHLTIVATGHYRHRCGWATMGVLPLWALPGLACPSHPGHRESGTGCGQVRLIMAAAGYFQKFKINVPKKFFQYKI